MTKYTDEQINEAIMLANQTGRVYSWETEMYRNVIKHLPTPASDEWIECAFEDIQKGDRVRMVQAGRTTDFHLPVIEAHPTHLVLQDNTQCSNFHKAVYYRIPAPVVHPDPKKHPVILVHEASGITRNPPVVALSARIPETERYRYVFSGYGAQWPSDITEWEPAKVVADDE